MPRFMPVGKPQQGPKPPSMGVDGSGAQGDVKFITVNGRVIPIRQKTGAGGGGGMSTGAKIATGAGILGAGVLGALALKRGMMPRIGQQLSPMAKLGGMAGRAKSYLGDTLAANRIGAGITIGKAKSFLGDVGQNIGSNIQGAKIGIQKAMGKSRPSVFQNIGKVGPEIPDLAPIKKGYISPLARANINAGTALAPIKKGYVSPLARASRIKISEGELVIPVSSFSLSELFDDNQISQILAEIQNEVGEFDSYDLSEEGLRFGEYLIAHEDLVKIGLALME